MMLYATLALVGGVGLSDVSAQDGASRVRVPRELVRDVQSRSAAAEGSGNGVTETDHRDGSKPSNLVESRPGGNVLILRGGTSEQRSAGPVPPASGSSAVSSPDNFFSDFELSEPSAVSQRARTSRSRPASANTASQEIATLNAELEFDRQMQQRTLRQISGTVERQVNLPVADNPLQVPQKPLEPVRAGVVLQWQSVPEFTAGKPSTATLQLQNNGSHSVSGIRVEVVIPEGCRLQAFQPEPMTAEPTVRWNIGTLEANEARELKLELLPETASAVRLAAFVSMTSEAVGVIPVLRPQLAVSVSTEEVATLGRDISVNVDVNNPGTGVADAVVLRSKLPAGLSFRQQDKLEIPLGSLRPAESRRIRVDLQGQRGGQYAVSFTAEATGDVQGAGETSVQVLEPQLAISIEGSESVMAGEVQELQLQIRNSGEIETSNVTARYHLPEGVELVGTAGKVRTTEQGRFLEWFVGAILPGNVSSIPIRLRTEIPGAIVHEAVALAEHGRPAVCRHSQTATGQARLEIVTAVDSAGSTDSTSSGWSVRVRNTGTEAATGVCFSCEIPRGLKLLSADGPSGSLAENGIVIFRTIPSLEPGVEVIYRLQAERENSDSAEVRMRLVADQLADPLIRKAVISAGAREIP
jgi:hypothetical protein